MPAYALLKDSGGLPINQYENDAGTAPEAVKGSDGAARVRVQDGHNVVLGTKADPIAGADLTQEWTLISLEKGKLTELRRLQDGWEGSSFSYAFSTTTTDADPGSGILRLNHATPASVTQVFIDDEATGAADIQAYLRTLDDSTSTIKGTLKLTKKSAPTVFALYDVTAVTEAAGYFKLTVTHVASNSTFSAADALAVTFFRNGDLGDPGDPGADGTDGTDGDSFSDITDGISGAFGNSTLIRGLAPHDFSWAEGQMVVEGAPDTGDCVITITNVTQATSATLTVLQGETVGAAAGFPFVAEKGDLVLVTVVANGATGLAYMLAGYGGAYGVMDGLNGAAADQVLFLGLAARPYTMTEGASLAGGAPSTGDCVITITNVTQATSATITIDQGETVGVGAGFPLEVAKGDLIKREYAGEGAEDVAYYISGVAA